MIKLIESGLFGDRLVPVNTSVMVERYNACLEQIGLTPTKLLSFHIDGWGWSPEIAEEQGNSFYLSHGMANAYGIIITPEQAEASMYFPYQSFDWDVQKAIFKTYLPQIKDITAQCGMWFDMDQKISAYRKPLDLLMIDVFTLHFHTVDNLLEAAREQRALVQRFNEEENAWADEGLRNAIIESSKKHGDLRFRAIDLAPLPFKNLSSFYTLAFNGVYVFRNLPNGKPLMVFGNNASKISGELSHDVVEYNIDDSGLIGYLFSQQMLTDSVDYFKNHTYLIELRMENMLQEGMKKMDLKVPNHLNSIAKRNMILDNLIRANVLGDEYFELETLLNSLSGNGAIKVSDSVRKELLHPAENLPENDKIVLWHLLSNQTANPVLRYLFDKARFFNDYKTWDEATQSWCVEKILEHRYIFQELIN